jgi:hypothetical protein
MKKHTILFLAANPEDTDRLALDREAHAIQAEFERCGHRDSFDFVTRWAVEPLDILRELRKLRPVIVHFSGHGGANELRLQGPGGHVRAVSSDAISRSFLAAGGSVRVVVLNTCYSEELADALLVHIDCVIGMCGVIKDDAALSFAVGFYGGLGERESISVAYAQGCAAVALEGSRDSDRPRLRTRNGIDASQILLGASPASEEFLRQVSRWRVAAESVYNRVALERFIVQDWLLKLLDSFLARQQKGYLILEAQSGMGKTTFLAKLTSRNCEAGSIKHA